MDGINLLKVANVDMLDTVKNYSADILGLLSLC